MSEENLSNSSPDISKMLGELLSNQDIISKISEIAGNFQNKEVTNSSENESSSNIDSLLTNPDIISKLPNVINVIKPIMSEEKNTGSKIFDKRIGLLIAMKPYLSPKRCEAIDYIARMSKLSETIKGLKL